MATKKSENAECAKSRKPRARSADKYEPPIPKHAYTWKDGVKVIFTCPKPTKLSKYGEWRRANPEGLGVIVHDWRAVMR